MNILLKIQYDGTDFFGSQIQPLGRTVQGELETALSSLMSEKISTVFSGRTDSGVHAHEQSVNFHVSSPMIPPDKIYHPLNRLLPYDIYAISSELSDDDFNARFNAKSRTYRYFLRENHDLFRKKYSLLYPFDIDIDKMNDTAELFIGKKDFQSFCSSHAEVNNYICHISDLHFFRHDDEIVMEISSDRFLQNMVRIIVSVFLELNSNKIKKEDILDIFEKKDRRYSPKTISPSGLFLWKVEY
ncbi:MAG: tRNA pseudouridine(38-40) synthase TruA [Candidatus Delongbacteria bacterium]|nr:tRNA pseudouridine(38-40) synthase TruA [Candidatus Delongbacteria bacterium]